METLRKNVFGMVGIEELQDYNMRNKDKGVVKRFIVTPDKHFPLHSQPAIDCLIKAIHIVKPSGYIDLGDVGEWESTSHWQWRKKKRPPLEYQLPRVEKEIKAVNVATQIVPQKAALIPACSGNLDGKLFINCKSNQGNPFANISINKTDKDIMDTNIETRRKTKKIEPKLFLESNFLRDYDEESYPSDSYEPLEELICTKTQLDSFIKTIEGCTYRLKQ